MLGSRFLKPDHEGQHGPIYRCSKADSTACQRAYESTLRVAMRFRWSPGRRDPDAGGHGVSLHDYATGFIPSQDSGFMFAITLSPQDAPSMGVATHFAVGQVVGAHPEISDTGVFVIGGNTAFVFGRMKPRDQRVHSVTRSSKTSSRCGRPGVFVFIAEPAATSPWRQNTQSQYQLTLQSADLKEVYQWTRACRQDAPNPGMVDINSDMQISSPQ